LRPLPARSRLLGRSFYERSPGLVARDLLGKLLVRRLGRAQLVGRITEVEAYLGKSDPASHAYKPRSAYNAVLFGPPGRTDVYLSYGMHYCLNFSCWPDGKPGVLIRAITPVRGIATMAKLRNLPQGSSARRLAGGPGRLCQAFAITRVKDYDIDVTKRSSAIQVRDDGCVPDHILRTPRIGVGSAIDLPLRFVLIPAECDPAPQSVAVRTRVQTTAW
jgi:DNA-3-methyladenine glycosylase